MRCRTFFLASVVTVAAVPGWAAPATDYSIEATSPQVAIVTDPSAPLRIVQRLPSASRAAARSAPVAVAVPERSAPSAPAESVAQAEAPVTVAVCFAASSAGSRLRAQALAAQLRGVGIDATAEARPDPGAEPGRVDYVYAEDRHQASMIATLAFGTGEAHRVPADTVRDPRPGLVEITITGRST